MRKFPRISSARRSLPRTVIGALDTFDLFWNKAAFPLEVYAIAAYRMS